MDVSTPAPPQVAPARREDPRLSGTWLRFYAPVPAAVLRLWLQVPLAACNGTGAAIALDDCNDLLQALDNWLAAELDWHWADAEAGDGAALACADCAPSGDPAQAGFDGCRLEVPWTLMRSAGPPPLPLANRLRWQDAPAQLSISRFCLDESELSDLEPGGVVVLPESMEPGWRGWLHLPDERPERGCAVDLTTLGWPPLLGSSVGSPDLPCPEPAGSHSCGVQLAIPAPVPAPLLTGWAGHGLRLADVATGKAQLWLGRSDGEAQHRLLASGRLLPWGHGQAMLIDERF